MASTFPHLTIECPIPASGVHVITMNRPPENRLDVPFANSIMAALRYIEQSLVKRGAAGAVILSSSSDKFWCTGVDLHETDTNIHANADGFFPLIAMLLDYPFPTIAMVTGHTFGGACPLMLSCDYRIMNSKRGFVSMPPVNLGLHFDGIGALPRLKLRPQIARKMLLEAYRWTGEEALRDGLVDQIFPPEIMRQKAIEFAATIAPRSAMGVYGLLRSELWTDAVESSRRSATCIEKELVPRQKQSFNQRHGL